MGASDELSRPQVLNKVQDAVEDVRHGPGQLAGRPSPFLPLRLTRQDLIQRLDGITVAARRLLYPATTPGARRCPRPGCHNPDDSSRQVDRHD
jgi:hypothetical protein